MVLVLTEPRDEPRVSIELVLRTLKCLVGQGSKARLWVLTRNVHEGTDIEQAPLWGLSRVAAAEHPNSGAVSWTCLRSCPSPTCPCPR